MEVKFKQDVDYKGKTYFKDDILKVDKNNIDEIWKLNEKGFIYPITYKEYIKEKENILKPKEG